MNYDRMVTRALLCLFLAGATACADGEGGERASGTGSELRCAHDVLEADISSAPWAGAAVDPATQELRLEESGPYIVSSTYGIPQLDSNGAPSERYQRMLGAVQAQLQNDPGLLAVQLSSSDDCSSGRTLAVWRSEEQMYEFVTSPAHLAVMGAANELLQPGYAVTHWQAASREQISLREAVRQLSAVKAR
jgi:heme-degrading monooxygenase HmoA